MVDATIYIGKRGDEEIEDAVSNGDVERWEGNDRSENKKLEWTNNGDLEFVGSIAVCLEGAAQVRSSCLLAEPVDLALQNDLRVTLAKDKESDRGTNTALFVGIQLATRS